jgi:hypothetical protein
MSHIITINNNNNNTNNNNNNNNNNTNNNKKIKTKNKKLNNINIFKLLFNRFNKHQKTCLTKTEELLDYILNSNNIKYIKNYLKKNSIHNPNLTNFDLIVKKIYKMSNNSIIIEKIKKIAFEMIYDFNNQTQNNQTHIKNLITKNILLTYESYNNIVSNSPDININNLYNKDHLETIIGYLILLNYKTENFKEFELFKWELLDASIGFMYQLKKYINLQLKYFNILRGLYASYSDYYFKLLRYNYDVKQIIRNVTYWFKHINLDLNPSDTNLDNWRIYYMIHSSIYTKNFNIRNNILVYPSKINNNFNICEIYLDYVLNFPSIQITNLWDSSYTIIKEYEYITIRNLQLLISMNKYILQNYKLLNKTNPPSLEWKHAYHTLIFNIIHVMNKSFKDIQIYISKIQLYFEDYTMDAINLEYINTIMLELNNIFNIYINLNFSNDQLSNIIVSIFKIYNNFIFEKLFDNIYYFDKLWKHIIYTINKKNRIDKSFINYLFDKLIQNDFDYNKLELFASNVLPHKWLNILDSFSNEEILPEEFYDPFTNEIIMEPLILPITGQITDKNVIYTILLNNPVNPFNRLELSIKELEEYNIQPEIVQKLTQFKIDLKQKRQNTVYTRHKKTTGKIF